MSLRSSVSFSLPDHYVAKSTFGMRRRPTISIEARNAVQFDDQCRLQVDVGYVAESQRAIESAMAIDEDCAELGIDRSPTRVASWGDDRRPPL